MPPVNTSSTHTSTQGLSTFSLAALARTLLWREFRSGQLTIISLALVLAVTVTTVISLFTNRLDAGMLSKSTEILGADLTLRSSQAIPDGFYQQAHALGLLTTTTLSFPSVVVAGDAMSLSAVKAVDQGYPLKGLVLISNDAFSPSSQVFSGPEKGEVWLESRLLALLDIEVGATVEVGRKTFRVSAVINQESDRGGNFYSLSPRLMMHLADLQDSGLTETGSRLNWRMLVAAPESWDLSTASLALDEYQTLIEPHLASHQRIETLSDNNQALSASLDKARQYLSLAAILAILLSGIAIAMAARDYARHHFDTSALLRTFGASQKQVLTLFSLKLLYLALLSTVFGLLFGNALHHVLLAVMDNLFAHELPPASASAWLIAAASAPLTLLGFALPHLLSLGRVTPLRVLRRELEPLGWGAWSILGLAMLAIFALSVWFTRNIALSGILVIGGSVVLLILVRLVQYALVALNKLIPEQFFSLYIRFAWRQIMQQPRQTATQVLAFSMILMLMLVISIVRHDLLADWQRALPDDAPNFFAMNIQEHETEAYQQALQTAGLNYKPLFPMVPGRLTQINGLNVLEQEEIKEDPALQRDLALTWSQDLPEGNEIVEGTWFSEQQSEHVVSVDDGVAKRLGIQLQDQLTFEVAGQTVTAKVNSLRKIDWGTLTPNFYMILSESALNELPRSYLTSLYVPADEQSKLMPLIRQFPTITLLDMSMVFGQIQGLVNQVSMAVEYLLLLVLLGGLLVLMAALYSSLDERIQQGAILRTLGASRANLRMKQWSEFAFLGLISGILALLGAELISFSLYAFILDLDYQIQTTLWLWVPASSAILIMLLGAHATRKICQQPPIVVLREL
jgi:putative ABC transport system permease protein